MINFIIGFIVGIIFTIIFYFLFIYIKFGNSKEEIDDYDYDYEVGEKSE